MLNVEDITIKALIDNTASVSNVMAEWGLSIYLNLPDLNILFDTGAGNQGVLLHNMRAMGVAPKDIDYLVLSHGHQDHTGGLREFFQEHFYQTKGKELEVICHPQAMAPQYTRGTGSFGCPFTEEELARFGARFSFNKEPVWLSEDVVISGEIPLVNDFETIGEGFFREMPAGDRGPAVSEEELRFPGRGKKFKKDTEIIDDQAIFIKTNLGLIIILGCAHRGMINTIRRAQNITGMADVHLVIGGTHLYGASKERMAATVREIKTIGIEKVGVSHCTGLSSACILAGHLGTTFFNNNAGSTITFPAGKIRYRKF
ncbi:MAG TPA: MBL fold metallo-hydrolase [Firmicutes bacterium]|nr:MBL fold metallo-hydrolase [Bacillota bacterium]